MAIKEIKFSVIVPVYNVEQYLKKCIDSILKQTYQNFELILVNDGSTDHSQKICEEYCENDNRIVLVNEDNHGLLAARRTGIKQAKGDYFVHVDSDDYCETILLEQLYNKIRETDCDLVLYGCSIVDENGTVLNRRDLDTFDKRTGSISKEVFIEEMVGTSKYNNLWLKCAKSSIVDVDGDYSRYGRLMMGEDVLQSMPLIENAQHIGIINSSLYIYCLHEGSMSRMFQKKYIYDYLLVRKRVYKTVKIYCNKPSTMQRFCTYYYRGLVDYLIKSTTVYDSEEYKKMIDDIKQNYMIKELFNSKNNLPIIRSICYKFAMSKQYGICKIFAKIFYALFR